MDGHTTDRMVQDFGLLNTCRKAPTYPDLSRVSIQVIVTAHSATVALQNPPLVE